ncbi:unnamed protein product [Leptidea sinapis]|uniref:SWIM-type domain-containing protein n=1 Tax=Leptidea sinapis TaxID=189913 RepID=A0A5E4QDX4_9NEOP|nr:unnamed protein product [Leptidea sinapis]
MESRDDQQSQSMWDRHYSIGRRVTTLALKTQNGLKETLYVVGALNLRASAIIGEAGDDLIYQTRMGRVLRKKPVKCVASHIPFELVEHVYPPVPEQLQLQIAFWSFPDSEDDIRLYSCLANGSADEFQKGEHLFREKAVKDVLQIGFHLSATVYITMARSQFNVAVTFDRQKISSCNCTCSSSAHWCSHIVAVCLFRIHLRLRRDQLQKFAQYLISELPRQVLPTAQKILDELLSAQPNQINTTCGAPDPTAGASAYEYTSCDVNYLSTSAPPAAAEWSSLLRPLRGREPEGMWNLLSIVREMFKRSDRNAIPLLEIITEEAALVAWGGGTGGKHGGNGGNSAAQHACSSLCDEVVVLWRLAALNPGLAPHERDTLHEQFAQWHMKVLDRVNSSQAVLNNEMSLSYRLTNPDLSIQGLRTLLVRGRIIVDMAIPGPSNQVLAEFSEHHELAFRVGLFALEMARPPASTKALEVKLNNQESELVALLKKLPTGSRVPSDEVLGFEAAVAALGLKANVSEADHPLLCEGTRRQRGDLAVTLLAFYKDDPVKLARIMNKRMLRNLKEWLKRYKGKRQYPSVPNQPSEASAHFMFELAKSVLFKAGGSSSTSLFTQTSCARELHGPHRGLHMAAFQLGLYALGLHNCVSANWLSRTYSSHVSWITGQAMDIGAPAILFLIDAWEGHLTPPEAAGIADKASSGRDLATVSAAAELALSVLPHAHALNYNEIQRAVLQCKEQSDHMLERACLIVEAAAKGGGVYPEVLYTVARYWHELFLRQADDEPDDFRAQLLPVPYALPYSFYHAHAHPHPHPYPPQIYQLQFECPQYGAASHPGPHFTIPHVPVGGPAPPALPQAQLRRLLAAYRVGMLALETQARRIHDDRPQNKFGRYIQCIHQKLYHLTSVEYEEFVAIVLSARNAFQLTPEGHTQFKEWLASLRSKYIIFDKL